MQTASKLRHCLPRTAFFAKIDISDTFFSLPSSSPVSQIRGLLTEWRNLLIQRHAFRLVHSSHDLHSPLEVSSHLPSQSKNYLQCLHGRLDNVGSNCRTSSTLHSRGRIVLDTARIQAQSEEVCSPTMPSNFLLGHRMERDLWITFTQPRQVNEDSFSGPDID